MFYNIFLFSDIEVEGKWKSHYTGQEVDTSFGVVSGSIDVDPTQNCGIVVPPWNGWTHYVCQFKNFLIMCGCEHPGQMYLQLRGLCPDSNIDRFYVPRNKKRSGAVQLLGFDTTIIEYDKTHNVWRLTDHYRNTTASTEASQDSYVLGTHKWTIGNDAIACSPKGDEYKRVLKLTGCRENEFTCNDGQCIRIKSLLYFQIKINLALFFPLFKKNRYLMLV